MEAAYPIRYTQWALRPGSGGAGTQRGGLGAIYEIELLDPAAEAFVFAERGRFPPRGVLGGDGKSRRRRPWRPGGARPPRRHAGQPLGIRPMSMDPAEWQARIDLAACYRLVARMGVDDLIYNHISLRVPGHAQQGAA